jgi:type II secretory pathway component PulF
MNNKGITLGEVSPLVITLVVIAVVIGVGATVLTSVQSGQQVNSTAYNASQYGLTSLSSFSSWLPTIAIVLAAVIVIGIFAYLFMHQA